MKKYNLIPQKKDNYCVCSVLQAILKDNGFNISQNKIANNLTPSKKGFYVDDYKIKGFLLERNLNYIYYPHNATPFNEPELVLEEMKLNYGFVGVNSHVYLLQDFKDPILNLIDPLDNSKKENNLYSLREEMRKKFGFFGLIKKIR